MEPAMEGATVKTPVETSVKASATEAAAVEASTAHLSVAEVG